MSQTMKRVGSVNGIAILVDSQNWVTGAACINAVLTLPQIPGFPDYRWNENSKKVYSTQTSGRIKAISLENINFCNDQGYKLWVDGECALLPPNLISKMMARKGKTKQEFKPRPDFGVLVTLNDKLFGQFENRAMAEQSIRHPGNYQFYVLEGGYEVQLSVRRQDTQQIQGARFYGIDE